jgi:hypothetical protein
VSVADASNAFEHAIASQVREDSSPARIIGVGPDLSGRWLEWAAIPLAGEAGWLVFHAMPATSGMLRELGLLDRRRKNGGQARRPRRHGLD